MLDCVRVRCPWGKESVAEVNATLSGRDSRVEAEDCDAVDGEREAEGGHDRVDYRFQCGRRRALVA